jgi:hypothetical protein
MSSFRNRASCVAMLVLMSSVPHNAQAQYNEAQPGARVRIQAPSIVAGRYVGTVLTREPGVIRVGSPNTPPVEIPTDRITSLEISRGKSRWAGVGRGAVIGTVVGAVVGVFAGAVTNERDRTYWNAGQRDTLSRAEYVGYSAVGGAFWGAVIGAFIPKERWDRFDVTPRVGTDVRARVSRVGLALSF